MELIENIYKQLVSNYTDDHSVIELHWNEIKVHYSKANRHYHNLTHINDVAFQLGEVRDKISHWNTLLFSIIYHDIIYNAAKSNNEEKSAELAVLRMSQLGIKATEIERCKNQILATKSHSISDDLDTNYFTDADLSILGRDWESYDIYCKNIRKEYAIFPQLLYRKGRKKVIQHFLDMDRIFKTDFFFDKFENQARENLAKELQAI